MACTPVPAFRALASLRLQLVLKAQRPLTDSPHSLLKAIKTGDTA